MNEKRIKMVEIDKAIDKLTHCQSNRQIFPLTVEEVQALCFNFKSIVHCQPLLLQLQPPIIICGDIHGQFTDLLSIFQKVGNPSTKNFLFLGDYVDRGKKSLQTYCLLMAYKVKYPSNFFLLRGNHECCELNKIYGFYDQCKRRLNINIFKTITDTFNYLPVAAVIGNRIFCVHGGLSPLLTNLKELNQLKRPFTNKQYKIVCDMLWSDPNYIGDLWDNNFERGVSFLYGKKVIDDFMKKFQFDLICRSHQVVEQGYQFFHQRKLITIFSAPNYCGEFQNFGGLLKVTKNMVCSLEQIKGQLQKSKKIVRSATPIKIIRKQSNKQDFRERSQITTHYSPFRERKMTCNVEGPKSNLDQPTEKQNNYNEEGSWKCLD